MLYLWPIFTWIDFAGYGVIGTKSALTTKNSWSSIEKVNPLSYAVLITRSKYLWPFWTFKVKGPGMVALGITSG